MEVKKNILNSFSFGDAFKIAAFAAAIIFFYSKVDSHINDEDLHVQKREQKVLTTEEYRRFLELTTMMDHGMPIIIENDLKLERLKTDFELMMLKYEVLMGEHEDLETKVSREVNEINDRISDHHK